MISHPVGCAQESPCGITMNLSVCWRTRSKKTIEAFQQKYNVLVDPKLVLAVHDLYGAIENMHGEKAPLSH
jgi:hypothetical protein